MRSRLKQRISNLSRTGNRLDSPEDGKTERKERLGGSKNIDKEYFMNWGAVVRPKDYEIH